ncbi:MAG: hypothetical protein NTV01_09260 [Bacteroidia bacterium]|nr:hypothetical protein [Bacteroidia bacterium]
MQKFLFIIGILSLLIVPAKSQTPAPSFGIKLSGYVKTDVIYDTRQSCAANGLREGHFYLFPDNVLYDADSIDLNASPTFHILSIQSRLKGDITGPDAFGAKTSGVLEAEFFGTSEADLNGFRLRHAYAKLDWANTSLLIGQTWHPIFPTECFPGTISFNTGAPFTPFSRNPQIKLTQKIGNASAILTTYSERDFTGTGIDGSSNKYLRNSGIPGINLQFRIPVTKVGLLFVGADFKSIRPELKTTANYHTDENLESLSGYITLNIKTKPLTFTAMGAYIQNATDLLMIGGYAVYEITDPVKALKSYTNLSTFTGWFDIATNGKTVQAGLFGGYSKNLGAIGPVIGPAFGRGLNIDYLLRISPRISFISGKTTIAGEIEATTAAYGTVQSDGTVADAKPVTNLRLLVAAYYRF